MKFNKDYRFDIQVEEGERHERTLAGALKGTFYECKAERRIWRSSANAFIECGSKGRPSGLITTEADMWVQSFEVEDGRIKWLVMPTRDMRGLCDKYGRWKTGVGDDGTQEGYLLTLFSLFK